jgi:hypothetical protein
VCVVVEFSVSFDEKLATLVRLPSSDRAGEVTDAVAGINRMLANGGAESTPSLISSSTACRTARRLPNKNGSSRP